MKHVYPKDGRLYLRVKVAGKWKGIPTDYRPGQEQQARALLDRLLEKLAAGESVMGHTGPVTVEGYFRQWIEARKTSIGTWKNDECTMRLHVLPTLGAMKIGEVRPLHLKALVTKWRKTMAPKSVWNHYSSISAMFRDACIEDLLGGTPCILTGHQLGPKEPRDPDYRIKHVYTRAELERLISDELVPMDRRVEYSLKGVAGLRHSEASGLTWDRFDVGEASPLGMMWIHGKGGIKRPVPIHPTLAAIMAEWRLFGWSKMMGRKPTPEDLVIPMPMDFESRPGGRRLKWNSRDFIEKDLAVLGMRHRGGHDLRATMISLARSDGAAPTILRRTTHKPPREVLEGYTTYEWDVVCREVSKFKIQRKQTGKILAIPKASVVAANGFATPFATTENQPMAFTGRNQEPTPGLESGVHVVKHLQTALEPIRSNMETRACASDPGENADGGGESALDARSSVAACLASARLSWTETGDKSELRKALFEILARLEGGDL